MPGQRRNRHPAREQPRHYRFDKAPDAKNPAPWGKGGVLERSLSAWDIADGLGGSRHRKLSISFHQ